jgi:hypothetical protein
MASTTLVREFIWRICTTLNDSAPQYVTWLESELVMAINDGQVAICKFVPTACMRIDSIQLKPSTFQSIALIPSVSCKPADGSTPPATVRGRQIAEVECNMTSNGTVEDRAIRLVSRSDLDLSDPDWRKATGALVECYCIDADANDTFQVTPKPTDLSQWVRIRYAALPTNVPAGNDTTPVYAFGGTSTALLAIDDANVDDLFWYVLARANLKDTSVAKPAQVVQAAQMFAASINQQVQAETGINPGLKGLPDVAGGG